jgi:SdpI/YfhL protein family
MMLSLILLGNALLLMGLSVPLIRRTVHPNRLYGFRTQATLKDERLWYEVNAKTGADLLLVGAGALGIVVAQLVGLMPEMVATVASLVWLVGGVLGTTLHGFVVIARMKGPA